MPDDELAGHVALRFASRGVEVAADERLARMCAVFKDRCATTVELADWLMMYFVHIEPRQEDLAAHVTEAIKPALIDLRARLSNVEWSKAALAAAIKDVITAHGIKMPQLAHAVRVLVCGRAQTPSIDAVLELFPREVVLHRLPIG
jgi:glutamyl-tRNA synthetase